MTRRVSCGEYHDLIRKIIPPDFKESEISGSIIKNYDALAFAINGRRESKFPVTTEELSVLETFLFVSWEIGVPVTSRHGYSEGLKSIIDLLASFDPVVLKQLKDATHTILEDIVSKKQSSPQPLDAVIALAQNILVKVKTKSESPSKMSFLDINQALRDLRSDRATVVVPAVGRVFSLASSISLKLLQAYEWESSLMLCFNNFIAKRFQTQKTTGQGLLLLQLVRCISIAIRDISVFSRLAQRGLVKSLCKALEASSSTMAIASEFGIDERLTVSLEILNLLNLLPSIARHCSREDFKLTTEVCENVATRKLSPTTDSELWKSVQRMSFIVVSSVESVIPPTPSEDAPLIEHHNIDVKHDASTFLFGSPQKKTKLGEPYQRSSPSSSKIGSAPRHSTSRNSQGGGGGTHSPPSTPPRSGGAKTPSSRTPSSNIQIPPRPSSPSSTPFMRLPSLPVQIADRDGLEAPNRPGTPVSLSLIIIIVLIIAVIAFAIRELPFFRQFDHSVGIREISAIGGIVDNEKC